MPGILALLGGDCSMGGSPIENHSGSLTCITAIALPFRLSCFRGDSVGQGQIVSRISEICGDVRIRLQASRIQGALKTRMRYPLRARSADCQLLMNSGCCSAFAIGLKNKGGSTSWPSSLSFGQWLCHQNFRDHSLGHRSTITFLSVKNSMASLPCACITPKKLPFQPENGK